MLFFLPEFKLILSLLIKHNVNFILVGGYAVIHYGYARTTGDMDIWLQPDNTNKIRFISALKEFEIEEEDLQELAKQDFSKPQLFFFGQKPKRIDFLTKINGVTYQEAKEKINYFPMESLEIPILQFEHLILSKISTGRPQDNADVMKLQEIARYRKKD
jgi:hypothetical protein